MMPIAEATSEIAKKLAATNVGPVGTIAFKLYSEGLFEEAESEGVILEVSSGAHVFRIVRESKPIISYYYWSPGTGSRVAKVDLSGSVAAPGVQIVFIWQPTGTQLYVTPIEDSGQNSLMAEGAPTNKSFRLDKRGTIVQVGDEGMEILDLRMEVDGQSVILPTASENWRGVEESCKVLQRGQSDDGYLFEVIKSNSILTKLVTGFETYCKTRLIEMEHEGITPDLKKLSKKVLMKTEDRDGFLDASKRDAQTRGMSVLELWLIEQRRVNFQEFDGAKMAFNRTYSIKFGEIGATGDEIDKIKLLFAHRHRVIHVSPIITFMPNNDPALGKELLEQAPDRFKDYMEKLHGATLTISAV